MIRVSVAGVSEKGPVRAENQDAFAIHTFGNHALLALCDGMGGMAGGGEAARAAIAGFNEVVQEVEAPPHTVLPEIVATANENVALLRQAMGGSPGTTLVMAWLGEDRAEIANIGDSRAYLIHGGRATQISKDHAMSRSFLTRAVLGDEVEADYFSVDITPGDVLMLSSDGLWQPFAEPDLAELLSRDETAGKLAQLVVEEALRRETTDNATCVVARIEAAG